MAGVPVGKVYTSQFNRAYETAVLAGFTNIETTVDLSEGGLVVTPDEKNRRAKALATCWPGRPTRARTTFSSRTSQTSSMLSEKTGSTLGRARHRS